MNAIDRKIEKFVEEKLKTLMTPKHWSKFLLPDVQKLAVYKRADEKGLVACVTCGDVYVYRDKAIQGGHFIGRKCKQTAHLLLNVWPQCATCNGPEGKGMTKEFAEFLGESRVRTLEQIKMGPLPFRDENDVYDPYLLAEYLVGTIRPLLRREEKRLKKIEGVSG